VNEPSQESPGRAYWPNHPDSSDVVERASAEAAELGSASIGSEHILLALLAMQDEQVNRVFAEYGLSYHAVRAFISGMEQRSESNRQLTLSADLAATLHAASEARRKAGSEAVRPIHLLVAIAASTATVTRAVLDSYAVPMTLAAGVGADAADRPLTISTVKASIASPALDPPLPDALANASPLAQRIVLKALKERLTLDGFVGELLTCQREDCARVSLAIRALDGDGDDLAELIEDVAPEALRPRPDKPELALGGVIDDLPHWLARTGDRHPDTAHLLLAALAVSPKSAFATALKTYGITSDLLVAAAVSVRADIGVMDKPGVPATITPNSQRGPAPRVSLGQPDPLEKLPGVRFRRRLFRGSMASGDYLNSDLQITRIMRWTAATTFSSGSGLVFVIVLIGTTVDAGRLWLLLALPLAGLTPEVLPVSIWLCTCATGAYFLPWPARVPLALLMVSYATSTWLELQWRRSDSGDPTFDLKRLRRDVRSSHRALLVGGPP
jgi:hypothetical protein